MSVWMSVSEYYVIVMYVCMNERVHIVRVLSSTQVE